MERTEYLAYSWFQGHGIIPFCMLSISVVYYWHLRPVSTVCFLWQAIQITKFDYRLANKLDTDLQKLRCRVNYHALKFADHILKMGEKLVQRMRSSSKHYIALHLRLVIRSDLILWFLFLTLFLCLFLLSSYISLWLPLVTSFKCRTNVTSWAFFYCV